MNDGCDTALGRWVYKVESAEGHPKWNCRRTIRLQSWRRSALKHQTVCQRDTRKDPRESNSLFMRSRQSFITLEGSRGWIRLRVVHRRPSGDAYRSRKAPFALASFVLPTLSPTYFTPSIDTLLFHSLSSFSQTTLITTSSLMGILIPRRMNE